MINLDISKHMMMEIKLKIEDGKEWMQSIVYENLLV